MDAPRRSGGRVPGARACHTCTVGAHTPPPCGRAHAHRRAHGTWWHKGPARLRRARPTGAHIPPVRSENVIRRPRPLRGAVVSSRTRARVLSSEIRGFGNFELCWVDCWCLFDLATVFDRFLTPFTSFDPIYVCVRACACYLFLCVYAPCVRVYLCVCERERERGAHLAEWWTTMPPPLPSVMVLSITVGSLSSETCVSCACVRACVRGRACVRACVRACGHVCVFV